MAEEIHNFFISDLGRVAKSYLDEEEVIIYVYMYLHGTNDNKGVIEYLKQKGNDIPDDWDTHFLYKMLAQKIAKAVVKTEDQSNKHMIKQVTRIENLEHRIKYLKGEIPSPFDAKLYNKKIEEYFDHSDEFLFGLLKRNNIYNVGQIVELTKDEFAQLKGIDNKYVFEMETLLSGYGLCFAEYTNED